MAKEKKYRLTCKVCTKQTIFSKEEYAERKHSGDPFACQYCKTEHKLKMV